MIGPSQQRVELQIRTRDARDRGIRDRRARALQGQCGLADRDAVAQIERLCVAALHHRALPRLQSGRVSEHTKLELFPTKCSASRRRQADRVAAAANVIDFAYAVHTDVGNMAVGCKINGKIAPLVSELTNGDEVEIITSGADHAAGGVESLVTTGKARAAIRRATRAAVRSQYAGLGRRIVERLCQRAKFVYSDEKLQGALPRLARASVDEVMSAVGRGEMRAADVARAMSRLQGRACRHHRPAAQAGERLVRPQESHLGEGAGSGRDRCGDPDPRHQCRSAGAVRAQRRRGAGRPHRRHPHARRGHHHPSDPVAGAEGLRGRARALARSALGCRGAHAGAFRRASRCRR